MAGAISPGEVEKILSGLGFQDVCIRSKEQSAEIIREWNIGEGAEDAVFSAYILAIKPKGTLLGEIK